MKKILLSIFCLLTIAQVSAELQHKLVRYSDNYGYELNEFIYNQEHVLIATHTIMTGEYECYDSLTYDNNGNLIKICGWQLLGGQFKFVNYIDYAYDENNRMISRTNYNLFGTKWELGGIYTYSYDAQGHRTLTQLNMGGSIIQKVEYQYEGNLLKEEVWYQKEGLSMNKSEKLTYYYNAEGRLTNMQDSVYGAGRYSLSCYHQYTYDEDGNCQSHKAFDNTRKETERHIYTYNDMLKSETLMPYTPELTKPADTEGNTNVYTNEEYWTLDANFVLQHMCDYTYQYVGINESAVDNVVKDQLQEVRKIMIEGRIYIERGNELYDLSGRRVK